MQEPDSTLKLSRNYLTCIIVRDKSNVIITSAIVTVCANMEALSRFSPLLVLLSFLSASAVELNYTPCKYNLYGGNKVECTFTDAPQVLYAFLRNTNSDIKSIFISRVTGMEDDYLNLIFAHVSSSASEKVESISLEVLHLSEISSAIEKFENLQLLRLRYNEDLKILPAGSLNFTSDNLATIDLSFNEIGMIEPGAFNGNFSDTVINFSHNNLRKMDEVVFEPLLSNWNNSTIHITGNPINCDCDLFWLLNVNRHLLPRVEGDCIYKDGNRTHLADFDNNELLSCSGCSGLYSMLNNPAFIFILITFMINYYNSV